MNESMTRDLFNTGLVLWKVVNTVPYLAKIRERMGHPRIGDLVIEVTSWVQTFDPDRVGTLLRIEGAFPKNRYVIEPYDRPGQELGWSNSVFVALPVRGEGWPYHTIVS